MRTLLTAMTFFAAPLNLLNRADAFMSGSTSSLAPRCNGAGAPAVLGLTNHHNGYSETAVLASRRTRRKAAGACSSGSRREDRAMGGYVPPHMREGGRGHEGAVGGDRAGGRGGRRGRQASSSRADRNRRPSAPATPDAAVEDAVRRKDAAERKLGKDGARGASAAASTLASIAQELRSALAVPNLSPSARSDAGLALGEALCAAAAATVTAARHGPLTPDLARAERTRAPPRACTKTPRRSSPTSRAGASAESPDSSGDDPDAWADATLAATTAAANALAARGDVGAVSREDDDQNRVVDALARAVTAYESATHLASRAEAGARDVRSKNAAAADALAGLWNLADARVKLAEAIAASGHGFGHGFGHDQNHDQNPNQNQNVARAETLFAAAFAAYELACARCDSRAGDDLAGLLMDWGVGHASHARVLADAGVVCGRPTSRRERSGVRTRVREVGEGGGVWGR